MMKKTPEQKALRLAQKALEKQERLALRIGKKLEKLKTKKSISKLKEELWEVTSRIVRLTWNSCYTCKKYLEFKDRSAGHFWTKGGHSSVKFDFDNLRVQCVTCNNWKSGNLAEYAVRLRDEIGEERFRALNVKAHISIKPTREWLEEEIKRRKEMLLRLNA